MEPSRYSVPQTEENQYYPNTNVLINKLDIKDDDLLLEIEFQLYENVIAGFFEKLSEIDKFGLDLLCKIHKQFLFDLYFWAGNYRRVSIGKDTTVFAMPQYINGLMTKFEDEIRNDNYLLDISDKVAFIDKVTYYKSELIAIHPFREGNGRTIRLFFDLIAVKKGYEPFAYPENDEEFVRKYIEASELCVKKADYSLMKILLNKCFR